MKNRILVVDDESRMRKLVKDFLVRREFEVLEAGDGEEAVDRFFQEKEIALIILDVMMPKMDGWEVCRTIRKHSQVPIIMLTAKSEERDELLGFELGVDEYISMHFRAKIQVERVGVIVGSTVQEKAEEKLEGIGARYEASNWKDYAVKVHALKSTSLTIGAEALSAQAKALELAGKRGDTDFIAAHHAAMMEAYEALCAQLDAL